MSGYLNYIQGRPAGGGRLINGLIDERRQMQDKRQLEQAYQAYMGQEVTDNRGVLDKAFGGQLQPPNQQQATALLAAKNPAFLQQERAYKLQAGNLALQQAQFSRQMMKDEEEVIQSDAARRLLASDSPPETIAAQLDAMGAPNMANMYRQATPEQLSRIRDASKKTIKPETKYSNVTQRDSGRWFGVDNSSGRIVEIPQGEIPPTVPPELQAEIDAAAPVEGQQQPPPQIVPAKRFSEDEKAAVEIAKSLRGEYTKATDAVRSAATNYSRVLAAARNPDAYGDMGIIFGYMKMLDPGSVVKETEYATVENARGWGEYFRGLYNRAKDGQRLLPHQRAQILQQVQNQYEAAIDNAAPQTEYYQDRADALGISPSRVITPFGKAPGKVKLMKDGRPVEWGTITAFATKHGMSVEDAMEKMGITSEVEY